MKSFRVSNFRLFDSEGTEVEFKPVTVLTGANSSGKSSFVKALVVFGHYLDSLLDDCRRDGSFDPIRRKLDFSDPKLKLKGFSSVLNRLSPEGSEMTFSMELNPLISPRSYNVSFSFVADDADNNPLDQGVLHSISLDFEGEPVLRIENVKTVLNNKDSEKRELKITYLNQNRLLSDFIAFCQYCVLPSQIIRNSFDDGGYDPEYCDENGSFNSKKAAETNLGKRLAKIQERENATFGYSNIVSRVPPKVQEKLKDLFSRDLFDSVEKCVEYNLVFYFPVLERFVGKSKAESIEILKRDCHDSDSMGVIRRRESYFSEHLTALIQGYASSEIESFIDYYRSLENYVLANVDNDATYYSRAGESFNFIEDRIMQNVSISYDFVGFERRHDKEGSVFSNAYIVLSLWQWAEEEANDKEWKHYNGKVISELWGKDNAFITRSIYEYPESGFYSKHILFEAYKDYLRYVLTEWLMPKDLSKLEYNTSSFTAVHRLHSFEEKSDFVKTVKEYLDGQAYWDKYCQKPIWGVDRDVYYTPGTFLNKWLGKERLNICERIKIENVEGLGFRITMIKSNGEQEPLADMGHGITQMFSLLLQIENALVQSEIQNYKKTEIDGGYGEMKDMGAIVAIEEPEVSLHPCYQSLLAEILRDAVERYGQGISFIVETHSEYLVRKMQAIVSSFTQNEFDANPFVVYYFKEDGKAYDLGFMNTGRFEKGFGPGFFDEAANLKFELQTNEQKMN